MIVYQPFSGWIRRRMCGAILGTALSLTACSTPAQVAYAPPPPPEAINNPYLPVSVADLPGAAALRTAARIALVIGNSSYHGGWRPLALPDQDAAAMAQSLTARGFKLIGGRVQNDVPAERMRQLIDATVQAVRANPGAIVVVYFAGHGFVAQGHNYLVPVDAPEELKAAPDSVGVITAAQRLHAAGAGLVAMFLDACRDYLNGQGGGLTDEPAPDGTFIGFAAQYGTSATEPPNGMHGYYTAALIKSLDGGFSRLEDMHLAAARQVALATAFKQVPVFRSGKLPEAPVRLATHDPQTNFAIDRNRHGDSAALAGTRCAAQSDFRLLISSPDFTTMMAANGLLAGPIYEPVNLSAIKRSCAAAFASGDRQAGVLRGLAMAEFLQRSASQPPLPDKPETVWTMLAQAGEEGDAVSNYVLGFTAAMPGSPLPPGVTKDRLITAAKANQAPITGLVSLLLGNSPSGADFRHRALLPDDRLLGDRLFREAVMEGDPMMVGYAFILKSKNPAMVAGLPLRDAFDRALRRGGDLGFYVPGTTVYETLFLLALMDAINNRDWGEYARLMVQAAPFLDRSLTAFGSASGIRSPNPAHLITIAACAFENGLDPDGKPLRGFVMDRATSLALFRYAAATGDATAKTILWQEETMNHLSCKGSLNPG